MASLSHLGFDATKEKEMGSREPIPIGNYKMVAKSSEWKDTKDRTGRYLKFEFEVIDGQHKGRKIWANYNLENKSQEAVQIARVELAALCRAVSLPSPNDTAELHNKPFMAKIGIRKGSGNYGPQNEIQGYEKLNGSASSPAASDSQSEETPPWMAK